jgi:CBS domain-containing protein
MREMTEKRARHVPVLSEGDLVGVISIDDVLKLRLVEESQEAEVQG